MEYEQRHRLVLLVLPLAVAIILRLYPYFLYGVPWGTDSWGLIRNTNELLAHTPTSLGGNPIFDSTNIYWPAVSLFGAVASIVFGVPSLTEMPIIIPLVASLTTLFFFLIAERLTKSSLVASISSLFFATAGFDAIFTASATKETFAYPLFMLAILLLLMKIDVKSIGIFTIASITLALSHHVTTLILLAIVGAVVVTNGVLSIAGYRKFGKIWLLPLIVGIIFVSYVELYAKIFLTGAVTGIAFSFSSMIPMIALFFVSVAVASYFSLANKVRFLLLEGILMLVASLSLLFLSTETSVLPFAPMLPTLVAILAIPYLLVGFFAIFGYKIMHDYQDRSPFAFTASWLAATLALVAYTVIGTPNGVFLIYRFFTFDYAPITIFASLAIVTLSRKLGRGSFKVAGRAALVTIVIGIFITSSYMSYASVVGKENLLAGHYAYSRSDYTSAQFVSKTLPKNSTLASDFMISDLYSSYFEVNVNVNQGYKYLQGVDQLGTSPSEMLLTYSLMNTEGYDLNLYGLPIPANWLGSLSNQSSLVFNNGNEMIWR